MRTHAKHVLVALVAALALMIMSVSANARILEISNQGIRSVMENFTIRGGGLTINCPLTLEGSFHSRTLAKTQGLLVGFITRAAFRTPCEGTTVRPLTETLPWHIQYQSFTGTLPIIERVKFNVIGFAFLINLLGTSCLYRSTLEAPFSTAFVLEERGVIRRLVVEELIRIRLASGGIVCPSEMSLSGEGSLTLLGTANPVRITLIIA
jgi:hypothetical protein